MENTESDEHVKRNTSEEGFHATLIKVEALG